MKHWTEFVDWIPPGHLSSVFSELKSQEMCHSDPDMGTIDPRPV